MFTKDDLKTGMLIELRNGNRYIVLTNTCFGDYEQVQQEMIFFNAEYVGNWMPLHKYGSDLTYRAREDETWDVVKVWSTSHVNAVTNFILGDYDLDDNDYFTLVYDRDKAENETIRGKIEELERELTELKEKLGV